MLNPSQITYSPIELFTLKPDSIQLNAEPMKIEYSGKTNINLPAPELIPNHPGFWSKYKWIIIGSTVVVGFVCWYAYKKNQKSRSEQSN